LAQAIFFDIGNTLLRPHPGVSEVCRQVLSRMGHSEDLSKIDALMPLVDDHYEQRYREDDTFWTCEERASEVWVGMYSLLARELELDCDHAHYGRLVYDEFGYAGRWSPYEDVLPLLKRLHDNGLRLAVISNWDSRLTSLLDDLGLAHYFELVISSADVGLHKPDPRIFKLACDRLGVAPSEVVHVGDHYYADMLGASSAGIRPVLIDRGGTYRLGSNNKICSLDSLESHLGLTQSSKVVT